MRYHEVNPGCTRVRSESDAAYRRGRFSALSNSVETPDSTGLGRPSSGCHDGRGITARMRLRGRLGYIGSIRRQQLRERPLRRFDSNFRFNRRTADRRCSVAILTAYCIARLALDDLTEIFAEERVRQGRNPAGNSRDCDRTRRRIGNLCRRGESRRIRSAPDARLALRLLLGSVLRRYECSVSDSGRRSSA